jgi:hypothetical protein
MAEQHEQKTVTLEELMVSTLATDGEGVKSFCWQIRWMLSTRSQNFASACILR